MPEPDPDSALNPLHLRRGYVGTADRQLPPDVLRAAEAVETSAFEHRGAGSGGARGRQIHFVDPAGLGESRDRAEGVITSPRALSSTHPY